MAWDPIEVGVEPLTGSRSIPRKHGTPARYAHRLDRRGNERVNDTRGHGSPDGAYGAFNCVGPVELVQSSQKRLGEAREGPESPRGDTVGRWGQEAPWKSLERLQY